ncbi:MAG: Do family serine endopeptidase, partial [Actinobacteria bacterium]|nr:Do family serine endopeptidase [Actinomycetota bacterium]
VLALAAGWTTGRSAPESAFAQGGSLPDFTGIAKELSPAIVNVSTTSKASGRSTLPPGLEPFERFFGPLPRGPFPQRSLGSGFVVDEKGLVVTNHHVVDGADEILVKFPDGNEKKAKLLGSDPKTDLAVLRVEGVDGLHALPLGDSDTLAVGEWVLAVGNPFGLDNTVTAGIVSAKGRHLGAGPYDDFIQTDASINPGNSGGPLIDLRGRVVGINTAIFSQTGGNIGIGFAIPANLAKDVVPQLEQHGRVTRGWLGVAIQPVTRAIADSLSLEKAEGALVAEVTEGSPADKAGVKVGDVIVQYDGRAIKSSDELPTLVARTEIGKSVELRMRRADAEQTVQVTVGKL